MMKRSPSMLTMHVYKQIMRFFPKAQIVLVEKSKELKQENDLMRVCPKARE
jgi:hypothetical protein